MTGYISTCDNAGDSISPKALLVCAHFAGRSELLAPSSEDGDKTTY